MCIRDSKICWEAASENIYLKSNFLVRDFLFVIRVSFVGSVRKKTRACLKSYFQMTVGLSARSAAKYVHRIRIYLTFVFDNIQDASVAFPSAFM